MDNRDLLKNFFLKLNNMDYIRPEDIPNIDLYMDQVTTFMEQNLSHGKRVPEDKILTKTMINNYTKNHLLPPPDKKKYSKEHVLMLIFIYYMKDFLSISDIAEVLHPITEKYFAAGADSINLESVYREVFSLENEEMDRLLRDVMRKFERSQSTFTSAPEEERETLQLFSLMCMLGFDVYIKKMMITYLIDHMKDDSEKTE